MSKFKNYLAYLDWETLPVHQSSQTALKRRANIIIAGSPLRPVRLLRPTDEKLHLHRLDCGQSYCVPYEISFEYKDALKARVKYYNSLTGALFVVIKHTKLNVFEISRFF